MPYVVSLVGFRPPSRYDTHAWTRVHVLEAAAAAGPYAQIDDQALAPVDTDPSLPAVRNVTTANATLAEGGWYKLVFVDATGGQAYSEAIRYVGPAEELPPTPDMVRARSPLLSQKFPVSPVNPDLERQLREAIASAMGFVQAITCRQLDPLVPATCVAGACEPTPPELAAVAIRAIALSVEQMVVTDEPKLARQRSARLRLRGFSAGPYAEQYWDPAMVRGGGGGKRPQFVDDPDLDDLLWALATEDARFTLISETTGVQPPAAQVSSSNFNRQPGIGSSFGGGFGRGPDGF